MPAAARRRRPPSGPSSIAIAVNLVRFGVTLTGFLATVVRETRGSVDPITLQPRALQRRPVEESELVDAA